MSTMRMTIWFIHPLPWMKSGSLKMSDMSDVLDLFSKGSVPVLLRGRKTLLLLVTLGLTVSILVISLIMLMMIPVLWMTKNQREMSMMKTLLMNLVVTTAVLVVD